MYLASNPPGQGQLLNSAILTSVGQAQSNGTQRIVAVGGNDQSQTGRIPVKVEPIESGTDHDVKCDAHPSASFSSTSASELGTKALRMAFFFLGFGSGSEYPKTFSRVYFGFISVL